MSMTELKRGTVMLAPHQEEWTQNAEETIQTLKLLLEPITVHVRILGFLLGSEIPGRGIRYYWA